VKKSFKNTADGIGIPKEQQVHQPQFIGNLLLCHRHSQRQGPNIIKAVTDSSVTQSFMDMFVVPSLPKCKNETDENMDKGYTKPSRQSKYL